MANTVQARKRARQTPKRAAANTAQRSATRTVVKQFDTAAAAGNKKDTAAAFTAAMAALHRAAGKGLIKKNTAARKISRMAAKIRSSKA